MRLITLGSERFDPVVSLGDVCESQHLSVLTLKLVLLLTLCSLSGQNRPGIPHRRIWEYRKLWARKLPAVPPLRSKFSRRVQDIQTSGPSGCSALLVAAEVDLRLQEIQHKVFGHQGHSAYPLSSTRNANWDGITLHWRPTVFAEQATQGPRCDDGWKIERCSRAGCSGAEAQSSGDFRGWNWKALQCDAASTNSVGPPSCLHGRVPESELHHKSYQGKGM